MLKDKYEISVALNGNQALKRAFSNTPPDLILLDIQMPDMDGFAVCQQLVQQPETRDIPIIFITAMGDEADERRGLEMGAVDYVTKPFRPAIVLARIRIHLDMKHQRDLLNRISGIDGLTGIANRRRFQQFLEHEWRHCIRSGTPISMIMADIDHFKAYNDHYGHMAGDDCLREVALTLAASVERQTDLVARYGGEEFACIMPDTDLNGALKVAHRLHQSIIDLGIPHAFSPVAPHVTISIGVGTIRPKREQSSPRELIETADRWLYTAKGSGRNQIAGDVNLMGESQSAISSDNISENLPGTGVKEIPRVLIVDDERINLNVLGAIFQDGFETIMAQNGEQALSRATQTPQPDIILLDIQMPDMDGYRVCQMLKNDPGTRDIPVLFITVLTDGADESRGLSLGAVDYISKPFHPSVVLARVKTHLRLKHALTTLAGRNKELEAMVRLRESVTRMVGSDFKRPLSGIISLSTRLVKTPDLPEGVFSDLKTIEDMGFQLLKMISQSLDLWKLERGVYRVEPEPVDIPGIIRMGLMETDALSKARNIPVVLLVNGLPADPDDWFMISGEMLLCYCMITNLMKNAIEASPSGKTVTIDLRQTAGDSQIHIHNHGGIPIEIRNRFFEKGVTYGKTGAAGLGVYTARLIAEAMGGSLNLKTGDDMDTILTIQLPSA